MWTNARRGRMTVISDRDVRTQWDHIHAGDKLAVVLATHCRSLLKFVLVSLNSKYTLLTYIMLCKAQEYFVNP